MEVYGLKELRSNISDVYNNVIFNNKHYIIKNVKKGGPATVLLSDNNLSDLLRVYHFTVCINHDKSTNMWEVINDDIGAIGVGETKEDAKTDFLAEVNELVEDYFENIDLYLKVENTQKQYPYYLRLLLSLGNKESLIQILNLN